MRFHLVVVLVVLVLAAAGCNKTEYTAAPGAEQQTGGPCTGILLNAQEAGRRVHAGALEKWSVVDGARLPLFTSDDVLPEFRDRKGVMYEKKYADAVKMGRPLHLGKNFYEVKVLKSEYDEQTWKTAVYMVDDATAAELRNIPNLKELVGQANLVLLMGQIGD